MLPYNREVKNNECQLKIITNDKIIASKFNFLFTLLLKKKKKHKNISDVPDVPAIYSVALFSRV